MALAQAVASMLVRYTSTQPQETRVWGKATSFHTAGQPSIPIIEYLRRLFEFMYCSEGCYVAALIYLDRVGKRSVRFQIDALSIHRAFLIAVVLAAKFYEDQYYNNEYYSKVGGVSNEELNLLENEFLHLLDFDLYISAQDYEDFLDLLLSLDTIESPELFENRQILGRSR